MKNGSTNLQSPLAAHKKVRPERAIQTDGPLNADPRLVRLVHLLARQAAEDYLEEVFGRGEHDRK